MEPALLTIGEVCETLRLSRTTVDLLVKDGELEKVRTGKRGVRIPRASVDAYVKRLSGASNGA